LDAIRWEGSPSTEVPGVLGTSQWVKVPRSCCVLPRSDLCSHLPVHTHTHICTLTRAYPHSRAHACSHSHLCTRVLTHSSLTHPPHADFHVCAHTHITHTRADTCSGTCPIPPSVGGGAPPAHVPTSPHCAPPGRAMRGSPSQSWGTRRQLPALTPQPLARTPAQPPPDCGQHHWPCALDAETRLATGGHRAGHRELSPAAGVGEARGQKTGHTGQGSSFLPSAPCSQAPHTAQEQGTRVTSGHPGLGSLWGHGLLQQDRAQYHTWASRWRQHPAEAGPASPMARGVQEGGPPHTQARPASAPGTGVLRVHEARRGSRSLCVSLSEGWRPP